MPVKCHRARQRFLRRAGEVDGFLGEVEALGEGGSVDLLHRSEREDAGTAGRVAVIETIDGACEHAEPVVVSAAVGGRLPAPAVGERCGGEQLRIVDGVGEAGGVEERVAVGGVAGLELGVAEADEELGAAMAVAVGADQVERLGEPADRIVGGELVEGRSAGGRDVTDGFGVAGGTGGAEPVVCQFTDAIARSAGGEILEGFGDAFVRSSPPVR